MALAWAQGNTFTVAVFNLKQGSTPLNLAGVSAANIKLKYRRRDGQPPTSFVYLAATVTIADAANGVINVQWAASDVALAGDYELGIEITMPNGMIWRPYVTQLSILEA